MDTTEDTSTTTLLGRWRAGPAGSGAVDEIVVARHGVRVVPLDVDRVRISL